MIPHTTPNTRSIIEALLSEKGPEFFVKGSDTSKRDLSQWQIGDFGQNRRVARAQRPFESRRGWCAAQSRAAFTSLRRQPHDRDEPFRRLSTRTGRSVPHEQRQSHIGRSSSSVIGDRIVQRPNWPGELRMALVVSARRANSPPAPMPRIISAISPHAAAFFRASSSSRCALLRSRPAHHLVEADGWRGRWLWRWLRCRLRLEGAPIGEAWRSERTPSLSVANRAATSERWLSSR